MADERNTNRPRDPQIGMGENIKEVLPEDTFINPGFDTSVGEQDDDFANPASSVNEELIGSVEYPSLETTRISLELDDQCSSFTGGNCCALSQYILLDLGGGASTYLGNVNSGPGWDGTCPSGYTTPVSMRNDNVNGGQAVYCCIPQDVIGITWLDGGWSGDVFEETTVPVPPNFPVITNQTAYSTLFSNEEFDYLYVTANNGISTEGNDDFCAAAEQNIRLYACQGFSGGGGVDCGCGTNWLYSQQSGNFSDAHGNCTEYDPNSTCDEFIPCDNHYDDSTYSYYCETSTLNGEIVDYAFNGEMTCNYTDVCGICGGDGSDCGDCALSTTGDYKIDLCGMCVPCGDPDGTPVIAVAPDNPSNASCQNHPAWNATCTGCTDASACSGGESIIPGVDCYSQLYTGSTIDDWAAAGTQDGCEFNASSLADSTYCDTNPETIPGCCFYASGICDCDGNVTNDTYCDCDFNEEDVCGNCGGNISIDSSAPLIINGAPSDGSLSPMISYSTAIHPTGLFDYDDANGSVYCDCNGIMTDEIICFDPGSINEDPIYVMACPESELGRAAVCSDFNSSWVDAEEDGGVPDAVLDAGCRDDGERVGNYIGFKACNYNPGFDLDCIGQNVGDDVGDNSCCVYPITYCESLGFVYDTGNGMGDVGYQWACDVNSDGTVYNISVKCPLCDSITDTSLGEIPGVIDVSGAPINLPNTGIGFYQMCGDNGYNDYPYTGLANYGNGLGQPDEIYTIPLGNILLGQDFVATDPQGEYWLAAAPPYWVTGYAENDLDIRYKDTCPWFTGNLGPVGERCGLLGNVDGGEWTVNPSCADPAALSSESSLPLYWQDGFPGNMQYNQEGYDGVTTCQYCPEGYTFLFNAVIAGTDVNSSAWVGAGDYRTDSNFYLGSTQSTILNGSTPYNEGHCYNDNDLNFLVGLAQLLGSTGHPYESIAADSSMNNPVKITTLAGGSGQYGKQVWNENGRLVEFHSNNGTCNSVDQKDNFLKLTGELNGNSDYSIRMASELKILNLGCGHLSGDIPRDVMYLDDLEELDLSYNDLNQLSGDLATGHAILGTNEYVGLCKIVENTGVELYNDDNSVGFRPTFSSGDGTGKIKLWGNKICPNVESTFFNTTSYPECLAPVPGSSLWNIMEDESGDSDWLDWEDWIYENLGYTELPNKSEFNWEAQDIVENINGEYSFIEGVCNIAGCTDERAVNFWPTANADCSGVQDGEDYSCCTYDNYLHFPWGSGLDGNMQGSYGGAMSLWEMIQALHAPICGFQYNHSGDLDVTNTPVSYYSNTPGACDFNVSPTFHLDSLGWLPMETVTGCSMTFDSSYPISSGYIDWWDGIWLKQSGYAGATDEYYTDNYCVTVDGSSVEGDSRPLEFIQRVHQAAKEKENSGGLYSAEYDKWMGLGFPHTYTNYSMEGIQYLEDYLQVIPGTTDLSVDHADVWRIELGRIDIAYFIEGVVTSVFQTPESTPEEVELWEEAPVHVSMSYSQKFISEAEAGYTLYPEENSPGVLRRSGQWRCADGGPADVCYEAADACGKVSQYLECTPCGNETSADADRVCVPLIYDVAAEGHEKITKTKVIEVPYFHNNKSNTLLGSSVNTGSVSSSNHPYYYPVTNGHPNVATSDTQFYVSYGHYAGSGSFTGVSNGKIGASQAVYKQFSSMLLDDEDTEKGFFISSGSSVIPADETEKIDEFIYTLSFKRKKFEDNLKPGSWTVQLSGSYLDGTTKKDRMIQLTDNSKILTTPVKKTISSKTGDIARRYDIISGSGGVASLSHSGINDRYGFFYPEAGVMVFGEKLAKYFSGSATVSTNVEAGFNKITSGSSQLWPSLSNVKDQKNALRFVNSLKSVHTASSDGFCVSGSYGEKEVSEVTFICRLGADSFNNTNNFTILSGSARDMFGTDTGVMDGFPTDTHNSRCFTGSAGQPSSQCSGSDTITTTTVDEAGNTFIFPGSDVTTMHGNPVSYITGIHLFDQHGEMVAQAKLNKPLKKGSDREAVIKVKLTF